MSAAAASHSGVAVCVLGSSSSGNATLVRSGDTAVLVDCGFPPRYIIQHLSKLGMRLEELTGIFITHIHSDHVNPWFVRRAMTANVPLYCPADIELHLQARYEVLATASHEGMLKTIQSDIILLEKLLIRPFAIPHDSAGGCFGYVLENGTEKIVVATDMAIPTVSAEAHCADADILVIESNHDVTMLEESGRPLWVKKRIRERGHLSNHECATLLRNAFNRSSRLPRIIMPAHVSKECNTNDIALATIQEMLSSEGIAGIDVRPTHPDTMAVA